MLETMTDCAHALGMAFGEAAKAETDAKRRMELFDAFQKGFLAVRMGIRLSMSLRATPRAAPALAAAPQREPAEVEPPERELRDDAQRERERDRDDEPVSLPKFLATLGVVARDAARLGDRLPADTVTSALPKLEGLLARTGPRAPEPTSRAAVLAGPRTRRGLLDSTAPPRPGPRLPPLRSGSG
jgi:hypothetical protein